MIRIMMIGDVFGRSGRRALKDNVVELVREHKIDLVLANGENAAGGNGITRENAREIFDAGVDVITMGNHVWNKKEIINYLDKEERIIRPQNYPPGTPGMGFGLFKTKNNDVVGVVNMSGRIFMPELDCPFRCADQVIPLLREKTSIIIMDFHAEATSEKAAMAYYLDGRLSAICGTHTHVQTADERILEGGTAFITDIGMTGPRDSVIGVKKELVIRKFITQMPQKFEAATGLYQFNAVVIDIQQETGQAVAIKRIQNFE
ncbi:hypothetical protein SPSYN_02388 [Sporotomaculum syntrophicum]|uniref:TIGR00282 family metallophosphoesterase n=1 Tax=Sporotomaculum syntrophicum TaxID=182264 RepID=A0A9D3AVV1_9FIRM|nr:hypothetical protein SPSYN_02388 [Sporotomaculum syntrophicum]